MSATETVPRIFKAVIEVMSAINAIGKGRQADKFKFRGIDDVYNELHDPMAAAGIFTTSKIKEKEHDSGTYASGGAFHRVKLLIEYTFWSADGSSVTTETLGIGMDNGDKAANKAMAVAHKYALMQMFAIPTEDAKDPETDNTPMAPKPKAQPAPVAAAPAAKASAPAPAAAKPVQAPAAAAQEPANQAKPMNVAQILQGIRGDEAQAMPAMKDLETARRYHQDLETLGVPSGAVVRKALNDACYKIMSRLQAECQHQDQLKDAVDVCNANKHMVGELELVNLTRLKDELKLKLPTTEEFRRQRAGK